VHCTCPLSGVKQTDGNDVVDGQIKRSFSSKDAAATAGTAIKKAYPVVVVTVLDSEEHTTDLITV